MLDVILETIKAKVSEHKALAASFGTVFAMLLAFFVWSQVTQPKVEAESSLPVISSQLASSSSEQVKSKTASSQSQTTSGKIVADIKGAVTNEGVYELPAGSRVTDLVKMAGGFTEEADRKSVNLAEKVSDEAVIKNLAILGVGNHLEIWAVEGFEEKKKKVDMENIRNLMIQMKL